MKFSIFPTLKGYKREYLLKDIFTGIIITAVSIPISMGYSEIAGLPAVYGLYASVLPILVFALFSTSPQFIFGVDAAPAAIVGGMLASAGITAGTQQAEAFVPLITLFTACWLLIFAVFRAGKIVEYISTPVMGGFVSGICFTIVLMQVPKLFGSGAGTGEVFELVKDIVKAAQHMNWLSLALGAGALAVMLISKKLIPRFPMAIVVMAVGACLTIFFHIDEYGVKMLAAVEPGLPALSFPSLGAGDLTHALGTSLTVSLVIMSESLLASHNFAARNGYRLRDNQEILAYAAGNFASCLVGGCPVNGSVSRTAMGEQFGGKTQLTSIIAGVGMIFVLLFAAPLIAYLPVPVLTAIVISALLGVIEFDLALRLYKICRPEFFIFLGAFLGVLVLGTIYGVVIGIVLSFVAVIRRAMNPERALLGYIPGRRGFHSMKRNSHAHAIEHTVIYRFSGSLFFANIKILEEDLESYIKPDTQFVIVDAGGIGSIDLTAAEALERIYRNLKDRGIKFYITEHIEAVNDQLRAYNAGYLIEEGAVRRTITAALRDTGIQKPYPLEELGRSWVNLSVEETDAEEDNSLQEYAWAFGEDAERQIRENVRRILENITSADDLEHVFDDDFLHRLHIWRGMGYLDEAEVLRRLEEHLKEIAQKLHMDEAQILERMETHRTKIIEYLSEKNPEALERMRSNRRAWKERLRKEDPYAYERLMRFLEKYENNSAD